MYNFRLILGVKVDTYTTFTLSRTSKYGNNNNMNSKKNTTKIVFSAIIAIAVIGSAFGYNEIIALDNEYQFDKSERPQAAAMTKLDEYEARNSEANFQKYSEIALSDSDLKVLGSEWELVNVATVATTDPFEVTKFVAYVRLIDSPENSQQCDFTTEATIVYDAKTDKVLEKNIPAVGVCERPLELGKRTETVFLPDFIPQAFASADRGFLTSEQGSPSGYHGGFGIPQILLFHSHSGLEIA